MEKFPFFYVDKISAGPFFSHRPYYFFCLLSVSTVNVTYICGVMKDWFVLK